MKQKNHSESEEGFEFSELIRSSRIEIDEFDVAYTERVTRRAKLNHRLSGWNAAFPILVGATTAAIGIIALLQIISEPINKSPFQATKQEAHLELHENPIMPELTE